MGREHWLGSLQVSVARQNATGVLLRAADECPLQLDEPSVDLLDCLPLPEPKIGRDLVIPAAGGVELSAGIAKPIDERPLNVQVDILQLDLELEFALLNFLANRNQSLLNLLAFLAGKQHD